MSLQQFLTDNRLELIRRACEKVARRASPRPSEEEAAHGVPLFLSQLTLALDDEQERNPEQKASREPLPKNADIGRSAALHGQILRQFGFTIDQVVHDYGDVCQAVTELADELGAPITVTEFHTLNWCLDNAIARAVTSWNAERDKTREEGLDQLDLSLMNLVTMASSSFEALRSGRVGSGGATADVVQRCLVEMRSLLSGRKGS
jgi:hypothetical protein